MGGGKRSSSPSVSEFRGADHMKGRKSKRPAESMRDAGCSRQSPILGRHASPFAEEPPDSAPGIRYKSPPDDLRLILFSHLPAPADSRSLE